MTSRLVVLAGLLALGCSTPFDDGVRSLGRFAGCLRRVSDGCVSTAGACRSSATSAVAVTLGRRDDGTFLWAPDVGDAPLRGRIVGRRFELQAALDGVDLPCGCRGDVREVIRGELLVDGAPPECAAEVSAAGCGADVRSTRFFAEAVPDDGWMAGAGADETVENVTGFRAWVEDRATPAASGGCSCAECTTRLEAVGGL